MRMGATGPTRYPLLPHPETPMRTLLTIPLLSALFALTAQDPQTQEPTPQDAPKKLDEARYDHFGTGITEGAATPLTEALKNPDQFTGKKVRLEAPITAVCQTKGCWMHLGAQEPPVMVKFKDYAFFVPKDASGRTAIVEGTMKIKQESVAETKHYLEDAGKHEEAAKVTEGRKLFFFMADGVAIAKSTKKLDEARYDHFGTGITEGAATPLTEALKNPDQFTGKKVRLEAPITAVCQTKGCWMHLGAQEPPVMVKFKDYAFFVPKDASGRTAIVEGTMKIKQESVAETKHYLEDAGKHEEAAKVTEGRKLFFFMADGVAIAKPAAEKSAATDAK